MIASFASFNLEKNLAALKTKKFSKLNGVLTKGPGNQWEGDSMGQIGTLRAPPPNDDCN